MATDNLTGLLARDDRRRPADADDLRALGLVAGNDEWDLAELPCA